MDSTDINNLSESDSLKPVVYTDTTSLIETAFDKIRGVFGMSFERQSTQVSKKIKPTRIIDLFQVTLKNK